MSNNALASFTSSALPAASNLQALSALGRSAKASNDVAYLTFNKFGTWFYGTDKLEVEPEDEFAVNPNSFKCGIIAWENKKPIGEYMNPIAQGMPKPSEEDVDLPWQDQLGVSLKEIGGDEVELEYKSSTNGGKQAIAKLADQIAARADSDPQACIPVVVCETSSYDHKKFGKIITPVLKIVAWLDSEGNEVERC